MLKNAIDWISRPPATSPFDGKPVACDGSLTDAATAKFIGQLMQALYD